VWHVSFICVTWLLYVCGMTHSYVWHDSCMCDMTHSYTYTHVWRLICIPYIYPRYMHWCTYTLCMWYIYTTFLPHTHHLHTVPHLYHIHIICIPYHICTTYTTCVETCVECMGKKIVSFRKNNSYYLVHITRTQITGGGTEDLHVSIIFNEYQLVHITQPSQEWHHWSEIIWVRSFE